MSTSMPSDLPGHGDPTHPSVNAGIVLVAMTATSITHAFASFSAEARVKALRQLLTKINTAHTESIEIDKLLEQLPETDQNRPGSKDLYKGSLLLRGLSSRLTELEDKVASGGVWRWSPLYLSNEIMVLSGELQTAYKNAMATTRTMNRILKEPMDKALAELMEKEGEQLTESSNQGGQGSGPPDPTSEPLVTISTGRV